MANQIRMQVPQLGDRPAAHLSLLLVCKVIDALLAKGLLSREEYAGIWDAVLVDLAQDRREVTTQLRKLFEQRGLPGLVE